VRVILAPRRTALGRLVPGTEGWICLLSQARQGHIAEQILTVSGEDVVSEATAGLSASRVLSGLALA
jgi:hypothetical protein